MSLNDTKNGRNLPVITEADEVFQSPQKKIRIRNFSSLGAVT